MPRKQKDSSKDQKQIKGTKKFKVLLISCCLIIFVVCGGLIFILKEKEKLENTITQSTTQTTDDEESTLARIRAMNSSSTEDSTELTSEPESEQTTDTSENEISDGGIAPPVRIDQQENANESSSATTGSSPTHSDERTIATPGVTDEGILGPTGTSSSTRTANQSQSSEEPSPPQSSSSGSIITNESSSYVSTIKVIDVNVTMKVQKRFTIKTGEDIDFTKFVTCTNSLGENLIDEVNINQTNFDNKKPGVYNIHYIYKKGLGSMKNTMILTVGN